MMGDAEASEHRASNMFGIVRAKCAHAIQRDLSTVECGIPPDDVSVVEIADNLDKPSIN